MPPEDEFDNANDAQIAVIDSPRPVVVRACPGAGKTHILLERTKRLLAEAPPRRGVAILSFSNAAIYEITDRFHKELPKFPSFVGTFDSFLWRFFIGPFGATDANVAAHLHPDLGDIEFAPNPRMRSARLRWFDCQTGEIRENLGRDDSVAVRGFQGIDAYRAHARNRWQRLIVAGELDYELARQLAHARLTADNNQNLIEGLKERFAELIVDEAQDCNPADLEIIQTLRDRDLPVSVIGDYDQAIYGFRHGAPPELSAFSERYGEADRHILVRNFRSPESICGLASLFRAERDPIIDTSLCERVDGNDGVHLIGYAPVRGNAVNSSVSGAFGQLVERAALDVLACPIIAHRENSARQAAGLRTLTHRSSSFVVRLANAVGAYFAASGHWRTRVEALKTLTALIFEHCGHMQADETFHQCLTRRQEDEQSYRGLAMELAEALKPLANDTDEPRAWLDRAKTALETLYPEAPMNRLRMPHGATLNQLKNAIQISDDTRFPVSTIHKVKGQEFPAVCVVIPPTSIVDLLNRLEAGDITEAERVLFVGITRAQRICAIALPQAHLERFTAIIDHVGSCYSVCD